MTDSQESARNKLADRMAKVQVNTQWTLRDLLAFAIIHLQHERPSVAVVTAEFVLRPVADMIINEYLLNNESETKGNA